MQLKTLHQREWKFFLFILLLNVAGMTKTPAQIQGALNGVFSVSENTQVCFSQGNLQYQASTNTWRFAEHQWDFVGGTEIEGSHYGNVQGSSNNDISNTYSGWIDLFAWGTSGYNHGSICYQPWVLSMYNDNYYAYGSYNHNLYDQSGQADWGYNAISNGGNSCGQWKTLSQTEWNYLLFERTTISGMRYIRANVNGVNGLVLLPDNWDVSTYTLNGNTNSSYDTNNINAMDWTNVLEANGAVFLPNTGFRYIDIIETGDWVLYSGNSETGRYWTASYSDYYAACLYYSYYYFSNSIEMGVGSRYEGLSVRLVHVLQATSYYISTQTSPVNGGTVTGAGAFEPNDTCTLTAVPNEGYTFINWTENGETVSTDSVYSFQVNTNRQLVANFSNINVGNGLLNGTFSVNENVQVSFSQGNLQYQASTNTWRFAENQWECIGSANSNISQTYAGWIDLFGWGTSGYNHGANCYQPWCSGGSYSDYYAYGVVDKSLFEETGQADWGYNAISNGGNILNQWRTLTYPEWDYIFNIRYTTSGIRYAMGCVNNMNGVILLPDDWALATYSLNNPNGGSFSSNIISSEEWNSVFEANGAVFLPVAGWRPGTSVYDVGDSGNYWSSSYYNDYCAYFLRIADYNDITTGYYSSSRRNGHSVRLVQTVQATSHNIDAVPFPMEGGIIMGIGQYDYGQICTLTASSNEGYSFCSWTENGIVVSYSPTYTFTVRGDRDLVANFGNCPPRCNVIFNLYDSYGDGWNGASLNVSFSDGSPSQSITFYNGSATTQSILVTEGVHVTLSWTSGYDDGECSFTVSYENGGQIYSTSYPSSGFLFEFDCNCSGASVFSITATAIPTNGGTVTGSGSYEEGDTCTLSATPNEDFVFVNWTKNDSIVSTEATYSFTVTESGNYVAHFIRALPELHVTSITHSALSGGQQATISWTVKNDGTAPTPNGEIWYDRVWLSVESRVAAGDNNPILLGTFENISALNAGEYYTQTHAFNIPLEVSGDYFLFVLTDAYDAYHIYWDDDEIPIPYNPPPYLGCNSEHCSGNCANGPDNRIYELSEYEHGNYPGSAYNDNFFYELVDIAIPLVPDLQVTSILAPNNFFSGTDVNVTATITNMGEVGTPNSSWTDALYYSTEPDFSTATLLATVAHSGNLQVDSTYQVTFTGRIPITVFGEAYFFVKTDIYEQVYEHVLNQNNVTMSNAVNIILTPPADLEPSDLVGPVAVSTAENLAYSYKVTNVGAGNPNVSSWTDRVYLCQNADTLDNTAVLLKTNSHYGGLQPEASYTINGSVALPSSVISGFYYLYVVTDAYNEVFEYLYDNNNLAKSSVVSITSPDLQITHVTAPEQITSGYPINLTYTIANNGDGAITNRSITDKVYISQTESLSGAIQIASLYHNINLPVGQSATFTCNQTAPANLNDGTYHLIVVTDANNDIHESNENNNISSQYPMPVMHQPLSDLQPVSLVLPEVIQAGEAVTVTFDITNNGDLDLLNSNCTFNIYATWNGYEVLCPVQSQTLPLGSNVSIGIGQTVHFVRLVLVPASVTSACTTFKLYADKENRVTESNENNNTITANTSVIDCPLPDLTVSSFTLPAIQAGTEAQVSFTVSNQGTADFNGSFGTAVYANANGTQILCPLRQQIAPETTNYSLAVGESLQFSLKVLVPPTVTSACNSFSVKVDEANAVLETNENNNSVNGSASVTNYPFNLTTQNFVVPSTITAGESTSVSWTVKNTGTCPNGQIPFYIRNGGGYALVEGEYLPTPWKDRIYLSDDASLSNNDIQLLADDHNTVLHPNGTYSVEQTVTLPYSAVGLKYLLCVSDATELTFDNNRSDNVVVVPVTVELGTLPDLHFTALTVEPVMTSDNAYWVHYTVTNEGERVTQRDNWMDAFYIGQTYAVAGAFQLGSKIHNGALEVGASYTDSIEILLPSGLNGDYFLLGFTDATNLVFENTNESNNLHGVTVTVVAPDPCDLIAIQPEFPNYAVSGEEMTVSWQLRNIGANPAVGRVRNAVYLSTDAAWSSDDVMLGYANVDINIAANQQQACSLSGSLTGIAEGNYYVIVKANILNALNESSYENNICVSLLTTEVGFPLLAIGEQVDRSMTSDQYIYYKLQVGPEYEGQTLSCTLTTMEQQVANGLYLSHEIVPTLSQYDFGKYAPYAQEIEILIPALEQGDYYLLAKGSTQNGSPQQVSIATSIINFEILHIDADHGANTGSITTKVTGAKFDSIMDFRLVQGGEYLPAEKVFFGNSTETYTTFDLVDMPAGTYAMEAELPGGIITIKGEAFTIEEGLPAELAVNIVAPSSVRRGNTFPVNIEYGNIGTTDLNVSGFVVVSRNGHPIGFTSDELAEGLTERVFSTAEANGNPDVLRPGYRATKTILVDANTLTHVSLQVYAIRKQY